jgi:hypothetical protein
LVSGRFNFAHKTGTIRTFMGANWEFLSRRSLGAVTNRSNGLVSSNLRKSWQNKEEVKWIGSLDKRLPKHFSEDFESDWRIATMRFWKSWPRVHGMSKFSINNEQVSSFRVYHWELVDGITSQSVTYAALIPPWRINAWKNCLMSRAENAVWGIDQKRYRCSAQPLLM